ncbi:Arrestin-like N-terminal [Penicillium maclennaniae]|uniref:Arrestin-like N-terminal n=1 Tax=Penicillium maclennaniae TaxID=1343394 RepID=UPI002541FB7D|nr:Arrestin-like N-terminal [Penicillium maclennaniae]KAJ5681472.1 Arrestin-like N-terminal [Penicillium maclennaniae]
MISKLQPQFKVLSLTTIATPHRADRLPQVYYTLNRMKVETGAFSQLTRKYMSETFNPNTPDVDGVRYFSYGAAVQPSIWSVFRLSHKILAQMEGPNDGLVSVASSRWGGDRGYKGTLEGVSHLDLINWTNRLKFLAGDLLGNPRKFNAIAFYLDIAGESSSQPIDDPCRPPRKEKGKGPRALAAMSATIVLDSRHTHYTNLDFLSGRVILHLPTEAAIGGIQVKLEGESRTRLSGPRNPHNVHSEKKITELEVHKILYKVATVFPTAAVMQSGSPASSYTFAAGSYEYPFEFKFPFNNACNPSNSMLTNLNFSGLKVEMARESNRHVKKTLPPSFGGFPGMADIKYFVKATVIRPQFYKENIRAIVPINFLPIEPPRTGDPNEETYARRQHQFSKPMESRKKGIFTRGTNAFRDTSEPPRVSVDARLPNPSILTCNEPVPLRLMVKKLTDTPDIIFLQMLQIELIAYTKILAHDFTRQESTSWVVMSRSNMAIPLGRPEDPVGTEWALDPKLWATVPLPNSVAPSFETCNIERAYELEVRVGMTHGSAYNMKPQLIVLPLRMPVKVYSGIAPPKALLEAIAAAASQSTPPKQPATISPDTNNRPAIPPRPSGAPNAAQAGPTYDDAPPSYEDAMADNLSPVDGPRREYHPPDASTVEPGTDAKSPVQADKVHEDGRAAEGSTLPRERGRGRRSSSESFDMLPTTPPESISGSPPTSPVRQAQSIMKVSRNPVDEESPPQYQQVADNQPRIQIVNRQPSHANMRPMNLGVPSRKPVPRSADR